LILQPNVMGLMGISPFHWWSWGMILKVRETESPKCSRALELSSGLIMTMHNECSLVWSQSTLLFRLPDT
jgi:hypothetical protein